LRPQATATIFVEATLSPPRRSASSRIDPIFRRPRHEFFDCFGLFWVVFAGRELLTIAWTTPTLVEICIGLEISGHLPPEF